MRRVGVPGGDVCDGSFHRGYTENSQREWRTGREMGTSPPNFIPLVSCKKNPERPRRVSMKVHLALFSVQWAGIFFSQANQAQSGTHRGS